MRHTFLHAFSILTLVFAGVNAQAADSVKVFLLAGQSNMQGHARAETGNGGAAGAIGSLRYLVNEDPANYGHLGDGAGSWNTRDDVYVWSRDGGTPNPNSDQFRQGNLTVGFGAGYNAEKFGPELGFGNVVGDAFDEPVVLVKTSWGGASLADDFRPPSAVDKRGGAVGEYYNRMLSTYQAALTDIQAMHPGKDIDLVGFGWHQGWNDRVSQSRNDEYEANMADFINDVRDALSEPDLPFVIATTGMSGWSETHPRALSLMQAQLNIGDPDKHPEFAGTVATVETRGMYRDAGVSPVNQAFHWHHNGETTYLIGQGMGEAMVELVPEPGSLALLAGAGLLFARLRRGRRA
ncbi:MAG: sialate O-acetylesterase [Phycisphaeraceae bacterium]